MDSSMEFQVPGAFDSTVVASIRRLRSVEELAEFLSFHIDRAAREEAPETPVSLLGAKGLGLDVIKEVLPKALESAFGKLGKRLVLINSTILDDPADDIFWWCMDRLDNEFLLIISPSTASSARLRPRPFARALLEAIQADVWEACIGPVRRNIELPGLGDEDFRDQAEACALSRSPIRCEILQKLIEFDTPGEKIGDLVRRCATLMRSEELGRASREKVEGLVEKWWRAVGAKLPKLVWVGIGTDDGAVADDLGFTSDFLWARAQHIRYGGRGAPFAETGVGMTGAIVDLVS